MNIIDIIVIVLILAAIGFLIYRGVSLYKATQVLEVENKNTNENARTMPENFMPNLRVTMVCKSVDEAMAERVASSEFLRLYNNYALLDAYISNIEIVPSEVENDEGKPFKSSTRVDIIFTVDAKVDLVNPDSVIEGNFNPVIGNMELRIGKTYPLKTMEIEVNTVITDMEILYDDK